MTNAIYPPHDGTGCAPIALSRAEEALDAITGSALQAVQKARYDQIVKHGHDAEADDMHPMDWLTRQAACYAATAIERIQRAGGDYASSKAALAKMMAFGLAAFDRIERVEARAAKKGGGA